LDSNNLPQNDVIAIIDDLADWYKQTKAKHDVVFVARMVKNPKDARIGNRYGALLEVIDARRHQQGDDQDEHQMSETHLTL